MNAIHPKTFLSTLQLSVGIYILRKTGKRQIVDLLCKLGVSASYYNVQLYESSTTMNPPTMNVDDEAFVQFVFDNTDHNVSTLDGNRTFHCLGGIEVYTPHKSVSFDGGCEKLKEMPKANVLSSQNKIPVVPIGSFNKGVMKNFVFKDTTKMSLDKPAMISNALSSYLWCWAERVPNVACYKGFMEFISYDIDYEMSYIECKPFVSLPPSDLTTINTALHFALDECKKRNQTSCIVTFDRPLYTKAQSIVKQDLDGKWKNMYVRLGGFHMLMSYFGAVGFIMDGSGLEELLSTVYAPQSVKNLLSGHAFARALRAHILVFTAIGTRVCQMHDLATVHKDHLLNIFKRFSQPVEDQEIISPPDEFHIDDALASIATCSKDPIMISLNNALADTMNKLKDNGPTAQLWVQYFQCISISLQFLEAERLGNFNLHLQTVREMLPIFHASGHFAYAKFGQMYLQDAEALPEIMPVEEYRLYSEHGYFTVRRSDKPWSGVWSDMMIETTLNRFFGTDLRHGQGVTPSVVTRYLAAMPSAVAVMEGLEEYLDVRSASSEQHADLAKSRKKRDLDDVNDLMNWLDEHDPFIRSQNLKALNTGIIADASIDCHKAIEKGSKAMAYMVGKDISKITLSRASRVRPLSAMKTTLHLQNDELNVIDSNLLFQRMLAVVDIEDENNTKDAFAHELSPYPLSFFDENEMMRNTTKSDLYKIMSVSLCSLELLTDKLYVIDGGWLLRMIPWSHSVTYKDIFENYYKFIVKNFESSSTVVFDGYTMETIGTKSYER